MIARRLVSLLLFFAAGLGAHVGSPDVFHAGDAGPFHLLVTIRTPVIVPGVAEIEIRSATPGIRQMRIVPLPLTGAGAKFAPTPEPYLKMRASRTHRSMIPPSFTRSSLIERMKQAWGWHRS